MALTRDFRETILARAKRDATFRREMLKSGIELMLSADPEDAAVGREQLRDYINATIGFQDLGNLVVSQNSIAFLHQRFSDLNQRRTTLRIARSSV